MGWGVIGDIGNAIASGASAVGNAIDDGADAVLDTGEDVVDTVVDTVQDGIHGAQEWLCENAGSVGCAIGNVVGGAIDGFLQGVQDIVHDAADIVRDIVGLVGSVLRLDLPGILKGLVALVMDVLDLVVDAGRFLVGGYVVGGIVDAFKRALLEEFVDNLVTERFGSDAKILATVRSTTGLDGSKRFGLRLPAVHRVFVMDSLTVPLWQMHENGELDLYALSHLLSFDSFAIGAAHPNSVVKSVSQAGSESVMPVSRWTIARYLESRGEDRRLRVYAMSRQAVAEKLRTASEKLKEIGVILQWNDGESYPIFRSITCQEITSAEYDFDTIGLEDLLARPEYDRAAGVSCELLSLAAFRLERMGRVGGRDIQECEDVPVDCPNPERSDRCCVTVRRDERSGTIYRDAYPSDVFAYVLPHEIGHYLGLCHCGHDGFQNVMYTKADAAGLSFFDWGALSLYWESEPHFSLEDGKNAWRFIVDQLSTCIGAPASPEVKARTYLAVREHSCAT